MINLHNHTTYSDGRFEPEEIVRAALDAGLTHIGISDHFRTAKLGATAQYVIAEELDAAGIVPFTLTGSTARYISQRRPRAPIFALTPDERTYRRLALVWGVRPVRLEMFGSTDEMIERGQKRLLELGVVSSGDVVVYVAGASTSTPGGTDMLKIHRFP